MDFSAPGFPVLHYLPKFAQIHVLWVGDAIQPSHSLAPSSPFAFNLSQHQGLFQWVNFCITWPKYWSFSFSISLCNEYSGLISFRIDCFAILAECSLAPQFKSVNSSALSFLYSPTLTSIHDYWKTIALTIQTFVGKVISLLFNMLSRFVIAFLPRSKCLLFSWL